MKAALLAFALLFAAGAAQAQTTTVVDFNGCPTGDNVPSYQGLILGNGWTCQVGAGLSGQPTKTLSWGIHQTTAKFKFATPAVFVSLRASTQPSGSGSITITTDAGETKVIPTQPGVLPPAVLTGFTKPATTVTVSCPCDWFIQMAAFTYRTGVAPPPPPPPPPPPSPTCASLVFTVTGANFQPGVKLTINGQAAVVTSSGATQINGSLPCANVVITNPPPVPPAAKVVKLDWTASTSPAILNYKVWRSDTSGGSHTLLATIAGVSYIDATVQPAHTYFFVTTALDADGNESPYSNEAKAVIP